MFRIRTSPIVMFISIIFLIPMGVDSYSCTLTSFSYSEPASYQTSQLISSNGITYDFSNPITGQRILGIDRAQSIFGLMGNNITIAVVDTGVLYTHEVFGSLGIDNYEDKNSSCRIIGYYDAVNGTWDINKKPYDDIGHGTHVTSILSGNSTDYHGVAPKSKLVIIRAFYLNEELEVVSNTTILSRALNWIKENRLEYNISIVNMSFGNDENSDGSDPISLLVDELVDLGIVCVTSAGNSGFLTWSSIGSPAASKKSISVGAIELDGGFYAYTSRGPTEDGRIKPDILAPGVHIFGASNNNPNEYQYITGTSQASPFVSGMAALLQQYNKSLSPLKIKQLISLSTRQYPGELYQNNRYGWGVTKIMPIFDLLNTEIDANLDQVVVLNGSIYADGIWARKLILYEQIPYVFTINTTQADLFIFESEPNLNGEPILVGRTGSSVNFNNVLVIPHQNRTYYMICKLTADVSQLNVLMKRVPMRSAQDSFIFALIPILGLAGVAALYLKRLH